MVTNSRRFRLLSKKRREIEAAKTILAADIPIFEKRLAIVCTDYDVQNNTRVETTNRQRVAEVRERAAQRVYLNILNEFPGIFLAFILTVSPRGCIEFDFSTFCEQHSEQPLVLSDQAYSLFWQIAIKYGIEKSKAFERLMRLLFTLPRPATGVEEEENCLLSLSSFPAVRVYLGDIICDAVECSPTHLPMNADGDYAETTQCIRTTISYNHRDTIIDIDVGSAVKLADMLFPSASRKISSALSQHNDRLPEPGWKTALLLGTQAEPLSSDIDCAYFTLRGASVRGIRSVFSASICEAIEDSELRRWEKHHLLYEVTDCITMQLWRAESQRGLVKLRVGHYTGVNLANKLYAEPHSYPAA